MLFPVQELTPGLLTPTLVHCTTLHYQYSWPEGFKYLLKIQDSNEINCAGHQIMFLKHSLIINASNTQSFLDDIKCPTFLSDFCCFQIHTAQYKEKTQGTFYLQCREQYGDNLHPNLPLAPYGMYSSFSGFSALSSELQ